MVFWGGLFYAWGGAILSLVFEAFLKFPRAPPLTGGEPSPMGRFLGGAHGTHTGSPQILKFDMNYKVSAAGENFYIFGTVPKVFSL